MGGEEKGEKREATERERRQRVNESKGQEGERIHKGRPQSKVRSKGLLGCAGIEPRAKADHYPSKEIGMTCVEPDKSNKGARVLQPR